MRNARKKGAGIILAEWRLLHDGINEARHHFAVEEALARLVDEGHTPPTLRMRQVFPAVFVGVFQNTWSEVDVAYCQAHDIQIVQRRRVIFFVSCLNAALRHHGVGVAVAEFGRDNGPSALLANQKSGRRAGATSSDDQNVGVVVDLLQIECFGVEE